MTSVEEFIRTGILEIYVMGAATSEEAASVERMAAIYPEVREELATISQTMEAYAMAHAVKPKATLKPLVLATINYLERINQGEPVTEPPILSANSRADDYAEWLNRPDMVMPPDSEAIYVKIIGATPTTTTAIVWMTGMAENEVHHQEFERFLILEGSCAITTNDETHALNPGDYFAIPLHVKHHVKVTSSFPCKVILQREAA
jgi:mannose-6-phosphate isomerase-like protein (cupin superfamily)